MRGFVENKVQGRLSVQHSCIGNKFAEFVFNTHVRNHRLAVCKNRRDCRPRERTLEAGRRHHEISRRNHLRHHFVVHVVFDSHFVVQQDPAEIGVGIFVTGVGNSADVHAAAHSMQGNTATDLAATENHQGLLFKIGMAQRFQGAEIAIARAEHGFNAFDDSAVGHIYREFRVGIELHSAAGEFYKTLFRVAKGKLTGTIQNQVEVIGDFTTFDVFVGHDGDFFFLDQFDDFLVAGHSRPRCSDGMPHIKVCPAGQQGAVFYQRVPENRCCHQDLTTPKRTCLQPLIRKQGQSRIFPRFVRFFNDLGKNHGAEFRKNFG